MVEDFRRTAKQKLGKDVSIIWLYVNSLAYINNGRFVRPLREVWVQIKDLNSGWNEKEEKPKRTNASRIGSEACC